MVFDVVVVAEGLDFLGSTIVVGYVISSVEPDVVGCSMKLNVVDSVCVIVVFATSVVRDVPAVVCASAVLGVSYVSVVFIDSDSTVSEFRLVSIILLVVSNTITLGLACFVE